MLYLAEIKKQTRGFISGYKTEIKLLARLNVDQTWSNTPNEANLLSDEIDNFGEGVLIMINLNNKNQLQGKAELAGLKIIQQLQKLSRLLEKSKEQTEEIERWKSSLEIQSQAISDKQLALESQYEQLESLEERYQKIERERLELEAHWENLRQKQEQLETHKSTLDSVDFQNVINDKRFQSFFIRLDKEYPNSNMLWEELPKAFIIVEENQKILNSYWEVLERKKLQLDNLNALIPSQEQLIEQENNILNTLKNNIQETIFSCQQQNFLLISKQKSLNHLYSYVDNQKKIQYNLVYDALESGFILEDDSLKTPEYQHWNSISTEELQDFIDNLKIQQTDLINGLKDQEKELLLETNKIEELWQILFSVEFREKNRTEKLISEQEEKIRILEEFFLAKKHTLWQIEYQIFQCLSIFKKRQLIDIEKPLSIEFLFKNLFKQQVDCQLSQQNLKEEISNLTLSIKRLRESYLKQSNQQEIQQQEIQQKEYSLELDKAELNFLRARITVYEELVQPLQNFLNGIRHRLESLEHWLGNY